MGNPPVTATCRARGAPVYATGVRDRAGGLDHACRPCPPTALEATAPGRTPEKTRFGTVRNGPFRSLCPVPPCRQRDAIATGAFG